ncbi:LacI family DNA-binding transcriptional regulator [Paenibacillus sp. HJGM_3]|uniref:LacI family DNA-binding transcriptional regulator n=1 Tax=Paenibacillus sp. HJGM_3 TaxID=3379816 RepID=UPI00385ECF13
MRKLTIKDVAKVAGVSTATVSRVLNGTGYVSDEVRQQVLSTVQTLNYQPNAIARSLKLDRSRSIGMIVPDMTNPYFTAIAGTLQRKLLSAGYRVLFMDSDENPEKEREALDVLRSSRVDGIVLAGTGGNKEQLRHILGAGIPLVLVDRSITGVGADLVMEDNRSPASDAVTFLLERGHTRIGIVGGPNHIRTANERHGGVVEAFEAAGIPMPSDTVVQGDFTRASGKQAIRSLLSLREPPTAVFSANNEMTFGLYLGMKELGVATDSLEVVSFGDLEFASLFRHRLSVIVQNPELIGETAAEMLLKRLTDETKMRESRIFVPQFKIRLGE